MTKYQHDVLRSFLTSYSWSSASASKQVVKYNRRKIKDGLTQRSNLSLGFAGCSQNKSIQLLQSFRCRILHKKHLCQPDSGFCETIVNSTSRCQQVNRKRK